MGIKDLLKNEKGKAWAEKKRAELAEKELVREAFKIDGKPWWEASQRQVFVEYNKPEKVRRELAVSGPLGWYIDSTDGDDGHINVGRTATGAVLTGGFSLLFGASRSKGKIRVTWTRDEAATAS